MGQIKAAISPNPCPHVRAQGTCGLESQEGLRARGYIRRVSNAFALVLTVLALNLNLSAGNGYLGQKGPAPLRFYSLAQEVPKPFSVSLPPALQPSSRVDPVDAGVNTNAATITPAPNEKAPDVETNLQSSEQTFKAPDPMFPSPLASDLENSSMPPGPNLPLRVTPQIWAELFRPGLGPTNAAVLTPVNLEGVWFLPPMLTHPPSSEAIYKVQ